MVVEVQEQLSLPINRKYKDNFYCNAYDDGKSTGEIRRFFNMLGPSDIRKVQQLMLPKGDPDFESNNWLFEYRFPSNIPSNVIRSKLIQEISSKKHSLYGNRFQNLNVLNR